MSNVSQEAHCFLIIENVQRFSSASSQVNHPASPHDNASTFLSATPKNQSDKKAQQWNEQQRDKST